MNYYQEVYESNQQLDAQFDHNYNLSDSKIVQMNIVELCVEIGELANETRCFKYWSQKKPSDSSIILEEFADCFLMVLCFFNAKNLALPESVKRIEENDINCVFQKLFSLASSLDVSLNNEIIFDLFHHLLHLAKLLHFSDEDVKCACFNKIKIVEDRLQSNY